MNRLDVYFHEKKMGIVHNNGSNNGILKPQTRGKKEGRFISSCLLNTVFQFLHIPCLEACSRLREL